jgi:peroxiredoxin family protein
MKETNMSADPHINPVLPLDERVQALEAEIARLNDKLQTRLQGNRVSIICFSGEWDKLFAALTIASGALAMGKEVHLFFTFWGINALRSKSSTNGHKKPFPQSMLSRILPSGPGNARLSRLNFWGFGKVMMKQVMKKTGIEDIDVLFQEVENLGAHFHICETTAELFGLRCTELTDLKNMDQCGVATFLSYAQKSQIVLFI